MTDIVYCPPNVDCPCYAKLVSKITALRAEVLEEAAVVFDRYEDDPFTAAVVADHLRRMKEAPCSSS